MNLSKVLLLGLVYGRSMPGGVSKVGDGKGGDTVKKGWWDDFWTYVFENASLHGT